ncbi:MAG TPA: hypothetical protein VG273_19340 [Bryobacteraceae bacterium]|jgi:hypothetical protein|nr:hypothetical protein [Bryobacteraceae bacterium]
MRQAIHIFGKDLRYLWREVFSLLLLAVMFAYSTTSSLSGPSGILFVVASCWMIVRLIHAEILVGDNQFWITRPYRWKSLLASKFLFAFAFVQIPILAIHLTILMTYRLPLWRGIPGLLWEQLLFCLCMTLPLAAIASVTSGVVPLVLTILIVPVAVFAVDLYLPLVGIILGTALGPLEWVKDTVACVGAATIAGLVLYLQYRKRSTMTSRTFMIFATALVGAVFIYFPWPAAFAVESRRPVQGFDAASLTIGLAEPGSLAGLQVPLAVDGVPAGLDLRADAIDLEFHWVDGRVSTYHRVGIDRLLTARDTFRVVAQPKPFPPLPDLDRPVAIRGILYLTLFGNARSRTIAPGKKPENVIDGLQCFLAGIPATQFVCRSPFRWPNGIVSASFSSNDVRQLGQAVSYSPFPAELGLAPIEWREPPGAPTSSSEVTVTIKKPIAHIRRDFSLGELRLIGIRPYQISR